MEHLLETIGRNMFAIFGVMALCGAAFMVASKSAVHSVLGFLFAMLCVAGCFLSLEAEFLGMAQILVYAGGIVVLFLFVVMLVELSKFKEKSVFQLQSRYAVVAVLLGAAAFVAIFRNLIFGTPSTEALVLRPELANGLNVAQQNAQAVSRGLFADYLLPFEILSVILLVALVGAVVLAKTERV
ncbi:NADH dehydrogenase subunit J [Geothrix limicola]|uniref:NADH-quinone oxidoreductase subunit J n=1 Tax=Geothrix limicola TaxID=2927978 RepID=A0ABQ5QAS5_9BACT|nr:NADH-quinone oxidoreductase subunit J [Geothrix limicola]GLH71556.1 NADH dehydrogenase subunit J [Geothrix limicola]